MKARVALVALAFALLAGCTPEQVTAHHRVLGLGDATQADADMWTANPDDARFWTSYLFPRPVWDAVAQCESGGRWDINTGNGHYGGLQFTLQSWRGVGGTGYPHQHTREEQIYRAERLLEVQGWRAWPGCSRKLGLR